MTTERQTANSKRRTSTSSARLWCWGLLLLIVLATAAVCFRLREMPLERDEGEYAYAGQLMLEGIPPYQLAYNMKFPGTYAAYAALMAIFGQTPAGIHLGLILVNAAAIILVYLLAARLVDARAGVAAAALFAYGALCQKSFGLAAHATHFVILPALGGLLLLWRGYHRRSLPNLFASGLLLGVAVVMKQPGAAFGLFAAAWLYYLHRKSAKTDWRLLQRQAMALGAGGLTPLVVMGLWLWSAGVFGRFWFWTVQYAHQYTTSNPGWAIIRANLLAVPVVVYATAVVSVIGLVLLWRSGERVRASFATGLLVCSGFAVLPGFNFRGHYFILMLPALALLTGAAMSGLRWFLAGRQPRLCRWLPEAALAACLAGAVYRERALFFRDTPIQASRRLYGPTNPFPESIPIANYLRQHARPGMRVAVIGSEPQIYFYSKLHSATGYIYTYALMEPQPFASQMQREMMSEIESARPDYVVWVQVRTSWLKQPNSDLTIFQWADQYCSTNYDTVGIVDMYLGGTDYRWDAEARGKTPASSVNLCVYRRKDLAANAR